MAGAGNSASSMYEEILKTAKACGGVIKLYLPFLISSIFLLLFFFFFFFFFLYFIYFNNNTG